MQDELGVHLATARRQLKALQVNAADLRSDTGAARDEATARDADLLRGQLVLVVAVLARALTEIDAAIAVSEAEFARLEPADPDQPPATTNPVVRGKADELREWLEGFLEDSPDVQAELERALADTRDHCEE